MAKKTNEQPVTNTWLTRLTEEHDQLKEKVDKLEVFISSDAYGNMADLNQKAILPTQLDVMKKYLGILEKRIDWAE